MITKNNLKCMLITIGFSKFSNDKFEKYYPFSDCSVIVDFRSEKIIYPEDKGFKVNVATTTNFSEPENFVVLECVSRLLDKGYRPENIELERTWTLGHEQKSGRADICVSDQNGKMLFIVECKTFGSEYNKEMKNILSDGGQLISYWQQERGCRWLVLYASNINDNNEIEYTTDSIDCSDDENILNLARKDTTILLYRNAFTDEDVFDVENLSDYYYRLRLQDMLDFSGTTFNKSIKTTPTRVLKDIPGFTNYRLSDKKFFELSIGNRVLSDEVVEKGSTPIYSANVFEEFGRIDKQNITDFSVPSILWGIDGDWMVNIIPANKPFYPTDHCGVLRIKTDDILPKYMALALQVEGEFERFSRSNRASTQRIANLIIQVPSVSEQQSVVEKIETIDKKISDEQAIITEQSEKAKSKFNELFGNINNSVSMIPIKDVATLVTKGTTPTTLGYKFESDGEFNFVKVENISANGDIQAPFDKITKECNSVMIRSELQENDVLISIAGTLGKTAIVTKEILPANTNQAVAIIRLDKTKKVLPLYLYYYLKQERVLSQYNEMKKIANRANLSLDNIENIKVPMYRIELQYKFMDYAKACDKLKNEAQERIEKLTTERKELIDKHFR